MKASFFAVFSRSLAEKEEHFPEIGCTRDISGKSIYFFTQSKIERGDRIFVSVHTAFDWAEGGNPPKLEGKGKIVRVEPVLETFPLGEFNGVAVDFEEELVVSI